MTASIVKLAYSTEYQLTFNGPSLTYSQSTAQSAQDVIELTTKLQNEPITVQYYITHPHSDLSWVSVAIDNLTTDRLNNERRQRVRLQAESRTA